MRSIWRENGRKSYDVNLERKWRQRLWHQFGEKRETKVMTSIWREKGDKSFITSAWGEKGDKGCDINLEKKRIKCHDIKMRVALPASVSAQSFISLHSFSPSSGLPTS